MGISLRHLMTTHLGEFARMCGVGLFLACFMLPAHATVNFNQYGNTMTAYQQALNSGDTDIYIPAGTYTIGPAALNVPAGVTLRGASQTSVIFVLQSGTTTAVTLAANACVTNVTFNCANGTASANPNDTGIVYAGWNNGYQTVSHCTFTNAQNSGFVADHAPYTTVQYCTFTNVYQAVSIIFANRPYVMDNTIDTTTNNGIEFWGVWTNTDGTWGQALDGPYCVRNAVSNTGAGGIFAAGCTNVILDSNNVTGIGDVGVDCEFCSVGEMAWNAVSNCRNGGITCFYSCSSIYIYNNSIVNNNTDGTAWPRAGIWLTGTNTSQMPNDTGHLNIFVLNNTISCPNGQMDVWAAGDTNWIIRFYYNTILSGSGEYALNSVTQFWEPIEIDGTSISYFSGPY